MELIDYISNEDYVYLSTFVKNCNMGIVNDKMVVLYGPGNSGKTTLILQICNYLGNCRRVPFDGLYIDQFFDTNYKLVEILEADLSEVTDVKSLFDQLMICPTNFITATNDISDFKDVMPHIKVITMNHVFK
jgi:ABC-type polar amino acid transport system ATPase subunit